MIDILFTGYDDNRNTNTWLLYSNKYSSISISLSLIIAIIIIVTATDAAVRNRTSTCATPSASSMAWSSILSLSKCARGYGSNGSRSTVSPI